ncbi:hypothetical protein G6F56_001093 [Rhizopus delemar]|nr:hypothetical protein G6F56_001093 [Rhizopus delemar]
MFFSSFVEGQPKVDSSPITIVDYKNHENAKETFRHSVASTATTATSASTSTQRLSIASLSEEDNCPRQSMTVNKPLENNGSKEKTSESRSNSKEDISDNFTKDPSCVSVKHALEHAICSDWICKYETPSFAFSKSWKKRFCVLADKVVYIFKSTKSSHLPKEYFVLTENTFVFVTEEFKKGYVIELRKPHFKWYIRCGSVDQMKLWLELMKKTVGCIKIGYYGRLTPSILSNVKLTDDYRILTKASKHQSLPNPENNSALNRKSIGSPPCRPASLAEIPDWETMIPPQLPPPRSKLPPLPLPTVSE